MTMIAIAGGWVDPPPGVTAPETANDMAMTARRMADDLIRKHGALVQPVLLMVDRRGRFGQMTFEIPDGDQDKDTLCLGLTELMRQQDVVRYAFVSEGWYLLVDIHASREVKGLAPSKSPNRKEGVFISAQAPNEQVGWILPMTRDETGKFLGLGENALAAGYGADGRFARLLYPDPATKH